MQFSYKQQEYIKNAAGHRYGIKAGAVRSGKTFLDIAYTIPANIRQRAGKPGLVVILGNTKGTLQRNIIAPMQELFGARVVSDISSDNTAKLFGETVYCLGADNIRHADRIRGASIKYCYGDECTTYNPAVFDMLKSRLDKPYSHFDGTCNPDMPSHWLKRFIDSEADVYRQTYTIDDNPFLPPAFVAALKREYEGSVYYDRYILGLWVAAEGAIYRAFADNPSAHIVTESPAVIYANIGVDFGGHNSAHSFTLTGFTAGFREVIVLDEWYHKGELSPQELEAAFIEFVERNAKYNIQCAYCDSAETTLIKGLAQAAYINRILGGRVYKSKKIPITDRIQCEIRLFSAGRLKIMEHCKHTIEAFATALWDGGITKKDVRLDNGTTNVDSLDSFEYSMEREISDILRFWGV